MFSSRSYPRFWSESVLFDNTFVVAHGDKREHASQHSNTQLATKLSFIIHFDHELAARIDVILNHFLAGKSTSVPVSTILSHQLLFFIFQNVNLGKLNPPKHSLFHEKEAFTKVPSVLNHAFLFMSIYISLRAS